MAGWSCIRQLHALCCYASICLYLRTAFPCELVPTLILTMFLVSILAHHVEYLTGDLNCRAGTLPDCLGLTLAEHLKLLVDAELDAFWYQAPVRQSGDTHVNAFGRHLLQFCQASGLHLLNGRRTGDTPA